MKKILLLILSLPGFTAFAQQGFFLQPAAGFGKGNIKSTHFPGNTYETKPLPMYSMQFGVGYIYHHLIVGVAAGYKRSGYLDQTIFTGFPMPNSDFKYYFNHLSLPVTVGYRLATSKHFSISPTAGIMATYNYSATMVIPNPTGNGHTRSRMSRDYLKKYYQSTSAWGLLQLNIDFAVSSRTNISCAPSFEYMITPMNKYSPAGQQQHNYTLMFNAGLKWYLRNKGNDATQKDEKNQKQTETNK